MHIELNNLFFYAYFSIIATAFLGTSLIFICFTVAVLLSDDRKFLALGGIYEIRSVLVHLNNFIHVSS